MTRWRDLTTEEQENFGNGCGSLARFFKVPDFIFGASCRQHDFSYSRGGWPWHKVQADWQFYGVMLKDCGRYEGGERSIYTLLATSYFLVVLVVGWFFFRYGPFISKDRMLFRDQIKKAHARINKKP
jgi:hypothetical protein